MKVTIGSVVMYTDRAATVVSFKDDDVTIRFHNQTPDVVVLLSSLETVASYNYRMGPKACSVHGVIDIKSVSHKKGNNVMCKSCYNEQLPELAVFVVRKLKI